ncbi:N-acetylmuramic acid 6-phosphate etherase [Leptotrichia sp. OH3620_COT-345]|uniref:N-acetylmuramic acid 6-phosphate etherase n=1 Tax=Leptotrichia sp. OH3620_COT-345 TaxID=2491048 RepID=UPI000F646F88|nr:N-acetylmuramic acid 6-phosphate etherase [Leptotrichia sp. OH3620_COT-345]RRD39737.1 N-acetylmuramic acid 6-phosphate etherase [Leptotrichia sp. OH3620_COT-345]
MIDLNRLSTEENNKNSKDIELQDSFEILRRINDEDKKVAFCVEKKLKDISKLIDGILKVYNENTRIIYVGSGTSGRLGILDASECPPTYGVSPEKVQGIIAGGKEAMFFAKENAEDNREQGKKDIMSMNLTSNDVVIGLTASGRTPYVIGAIEYADSIGAVTGSITCSENSELSRISQYPIEVVVGPEIVTGSTRMKSGTAQKMILNMISTTVMIKLGKVFSGYMVDVKTSNYKLIERAKRIIMETTGCKYEKADMILIEAGNNVKTAITMILLNIDKETATKKLKKYDNNVARLIHEHTDKA